jgi:hypothetical protein
MMAQAAETQWDYEPLWAKAVCYMERALAEERNGDLFAFWASLALEFIARSALAYIHPGLLAAATDRENGSSNLLYAFGFPPKTTKPFVPKSVETNEVFSRCEQVAPDFTHDLKIFCAGMTARRNEELHSGGLPFNNFPNSFWLPRFYAACKALLTFQEKAMSDLLGDEEASAAETMLGSIADDAAKKVKGLIHTHLEIWNAKSQPEKDRLAAVAGLQARPHLGHVVSCPACKSKCLLKGEEIRQQPAELEGDYIVVRQIMLPTNLRCTACELVISDHAALHAADLGGQFTATSYYDPMEYYGGLPEPEEEYDNE